MSDKLVLIFQFLQEHTLKLRSCEFFSSYINNKTTLCLLHCNSIFILKLKVCSAYKNHLRYKSTIYINLKHTNYNENYFIMYILEKWNEKIKVFGKFKTFISSKKKISSLIKNARNASTKKLIAQYFFSLVQFFLIIDIDEKQMTLN